MRPKPTPSGQTARRRALQGAVVAVALPLLLPACAPTPPGPAGGLAPANRVAARGHLAVQDRGGRRVLDAATIEPWGAGDLDHVTLELSTQAAPGDPLFTLLVDRANLASTALTFSNLDRDTDYRILARAYRLPRAGSGAEVPGSEIDDAAAHPDSCTTRFSTSEIPALELGPIAVQLGDRTFSGGATGAALDVAPGQVNHVGGVGGSLFAPGTTRPFAAGFASPSALAVKANGDLYASTFLGKVQRAPFRSQPPLAVPADFVTAVAASSGIAIRPDGTLLVADYNAGTAGSGGIHAFATSGAAATYASGEAFGPALTRPHGLALDSLGNLYVTLEAGVLKLDASGSTVATYLATTALDHAFAQAQWVAVDSHDDAIVADVGAGSLYKITPGGEVTLLASGFAHLNGVAVGGDDVVYAANTAAGTVSQVTPQGAVTPFVGGLTNPYGLATSPDGRTLYIGSYSAGTVTAAATGHTRSLPN